MITMAMIGGLLFSPFAHAAAKIDLNTATVQELQNVNGIGQKTAEAIVLYRKEHGSFFDVSE